MIMNPQQSIETSALNPVAAPIEDSYVRDELNKPGGWRLFHPYEENWKV